LAVPNHLIDPETGNSEQSNHNSNARGITLTPDCAGADCGDVRERAQAHLDEIERRRARLGAIADKLREVIAACPGRGATHACAILDTFTAGDSDSTG
jgi:hypothetical protein